MARAGGVINCRSALRGEGDQAKLLAEGACGATLRFPFNKGVIACAPPTTQGRGPPSQPPQGGMKKARRARAKVALRAMYR